MKCFAEGCGREAMHERHYRCVYWMPACNGHALDLSHDCKPGVGELRERPTTHERRLYAIDDLRRLQRLDHIREGLIPPTGEDTMAGVKDF